MHWCSIPYCGFRSSSTGQVATAAPVSQSASATPYLVDAGAADVIGEPSEVGFMGYDDSFQKGSGVHNRQYACAFHTVDRASGKRNLIVVLDSLTGWQSLRDELVKSIRA
ncbi:neutral/alkaline non-lysosomal ceramidase N-terminal domain-containing protein [Rothia sp. 27098_8_161]|uniref:neutral/alkaline non-lysosomal ceramidase N-terminal domain-containing protein n=1 Tax=Rothia sp. 27098_8_161 TaxID=3003678 RepID=UPI00352D8A64